MKTQIGLIALIIFLFIPAAYASAQDCLSYETDGVSLIGTISKKTFPGPPNYESIKKGDKPETYWILHLAKPICMTASGDNDAEANVTDLQLILTDSDYAIYRKVLRQKVSVNVRGKLSHAITGHHHTSVLIEVSGLFVRIL